MYDFEAVTGITRENVEQIMRDRAKIKVVCAWCQTDMGTKDGDGTTGVSHGICAACSVETFGEGDRT